MRGNPTSMEMGLKWHVGWSQITKTMQGCHATHAHAHGQQAQIQRSYIKHVKINPKTYGQI